MLQLPSHTAKLSTTFMIVIMTGFLLAITAFAVWQTHSPIEATRHITLDIPINKTAGPYAFYNHSAELKSKLDHLTSPEVIALATQALKQAGIEIPASDVKTSITPRFDPAKPAASLDIHHQQQAVVDALAALLVPLAKP
jgi:hypothetical protein